MSTSPATPTTPTTPTTPKTPTPPPGSSAALESSLRALRIAENTPPIRDIPRPALTTSSARTTPTPKKKKAKQQQQQQQPVADSWEDEVDDTSEPEPETGSDSLQSPMSPATPATATEGPLDPPPTPIFPQTAQPWLAMEKTPAYRCTKGAGGPARDTDRDRDSSSGSRSPVGPSRRPEKQTAVAGRMIAGALGIRAPKRTEEQRAYDRAVKEQEMRRRNREREEAAKMREEEERAKAAIWDD